jgi:hypothetical protein
MGAPAGVGAPPARGPYYGYDDRPRGDIRERAIGIPHAEGERCGRPVRRACSIHAVSSDRFHCGAQADPRRDLVARGEGLQVPDRPCRPSTAGSERVGRATLPSAIVPSPSEQSRARSPSCPTRATRSRSTRRRCRHDLGEHSGFGYARHPPVRHTRCSCATTWRPAMYPSVTMGPSVAPAPG